MTEENITMEVEPIAEGKKSFEEKLRQGKSFSDKTFNLYLNNLTRLNGGPLKNLNFLKDTTAIIEKISKFKPNTQRTYYIGIVSILKDNPKFKKPFQVYYDLMMEFNKNLKSNNTKSESQEKNWLEQNQILEQQKSLQEQAVPLLRKKKLNELDYQTLLNWLVISLYTLQPPRRNADYQFCFLTKKWNADLPTNVNYYDTSNGTFYLNNYKTAKTYQLQEVKAPEELSQVIQAFLKIHPLKANFKKKTDLIPLLVNKEGEPFEKINSITRILNKIFGKKVGVSLLRNIYLTDRYGDKVSNLEDDAEKMGTSSNTILNNYVKVEPTEKNT